MLKFVSPFPVIHVLYNIHPFRMMFGSLCSVIIQFSTKFENNPDSLSLIENSPSLELKERHGVKKKKNPFFKVQSKNSMEKTWTLGLQWSIIVINDIEEC